MGCVAVESISDVARRAKVANIETIGPLGGAGALADGSLLTWRTLRISDTSVEELPFFIEWGEDTTHPSHNQPHACGRSPDLVASQESASGTNSPFVQRVRQL